MCFGVDGESEDVAEPNAEETKNEGENGVGAGAEPFAVFSEGQGLQAERRESGVAAADADHEKLAKGGRGEDAAFGAGEGGEGADDEGAGDIDEESAPRESLADALATKPETPQRARLPEAAA